MAEAKTLQDDAKPQESTQAVRSQNTLLHYKEGNSTNKTDTWVQVTNLSDVTGFNGSANMADVTRLDSKGKEKRPGLQDWGQVTIALFINFKEKSHKALLDAKQNGEALDFKLTLSDKSKIEFTAFVKDFPISAKVDQYVAGSINLEITGDITLTVGTGT